jgi:hypothetical protein
MIATRRYTEEEEEEERVPLTANPKTTNTLSLFAGLSFPEVPKTQINIKNDRKESIDTVGLRDMEMVSMENTNQESMHLLSQEQERFEESETTTDFMNSLPNSISISTINTNIAATTTKPKLKGQLKTLYATADIIHSPYDTIVATAPPPPPPSLSSSSMMMTTSTVAYPELPSLDTSTVVGRSAPLSNNNTTHPQLSSSAMMMRGEENEPSNVTGTTILPPTVTTSDTITNNNNATANTTSNLVEELLQENQRLQTEIQQLQYLLCTTTDTTNSSTQQVTCYSLHDTLYILYYTILDL